MGGEGERHGLMTTSECIRGTQKGKGKNPEICASHPDGIHRWSKTFRDKVGKDRFFVLLRCRYCSDFRLAQFLRTVLPSGRVEISQSVEIVPARYEGELRESYVNMKQIGLEKIDSHAQSL